MHLVSPVTCVAVFMIFEHVYYVQSVWKQKKKTWWRNVFWLWQDTDFCQTYANKCKHFLALFFWQLFKPKCWFLLTVAAETARPTRRDGMHNSFDMSDWLMLTFSHSRAGNIKTFSGFVHRGRKVNCWQPRRPQWVMECASLHIWFWSWYWEENMVEKQHMLPRDQRGTTVHRSTGPRGKLFNQQRNKRIQSSLWPIWRKQKM